MYVSEPASPIARTRTVRPFRQALASQLRDWTGDGYRKARCGPDTRRYTSRNRCGPVGWRRTSR